MSQTTSATIVDRNAGRSQARSAIEKERTARSAVEASAGRPFNDLEWDRRRARLLEYVSLLRDWSGSKTADDFAFSKAA